ncbi:MAG: 3-phosphoshikimate 1-carboxyvinyltransferase [Rudaea sp.]|uniref:3-phosphoshikimate 1-carboxyvinyltransferase n=1 Tax=unclassified Rudaea TaxID=2627037 RepID=UPI0010F64460|nr:MULTISPECIES: 3-phosphoshikimate 1-carboxyvinyltransferase [unclassified Rudaea]MBN8884881.1 3-phosphoshikimate 1-carboxyvinyltransferase [Rudaea sp.]MBR0347418.1 3-phosphoshikimate 1-carboxyvinyltransferase [Rudaea sp.]
MTQTAKPVNWTSSPAAALRGEIRVPGDKSISHRAVMFASLADGVSRITGFLEGEDTRATARAFAQMGVRIDTPNASERIVHGVGIDGLKPPAEAIDCGNAGTGMRLLAGLLAGQSFDTVLIGDESLSRRPMRRVIDPLAKMGAKIEANEGGLPPLRVSGGQPLKGIDYALPVASAQVKSALLLAGLYARGETQVHEPHPTRDYTERMLHAFGYPIEFSEGHAKLSGGHRLRATDVTVPADFSSAAFFLVAASIVPGSELTLRDVGMNPRRTGLLQALRLMGADIRETNVRAAGGEAIADLTVRHAPLHGIDVPVELVPDMIDEFPALFVAAAVAEGTTRVIGAAELRVKESDRIAVMAKGLRALGARIEETPDGAIITGGTLQAGEADSAGDHRCAMSFCVAGLVAKGAVGVLDCANVATSFPGFFNLANDCGFALV